MAKVGNFKQVTSGYLSQDQINYNYSLITTAFNNTLSLDGSTPNAMQADLDMNGYSILNGTYTLKEYTVSNAPQASSSNKGLLIYVSDGDSGSPCLAVSDGSTFRRISLGSTISTT